MDFMTCNACQHLVEVNPTGICLGCQMGFTGPQKDSWTHHRDRHDDNQNDRVKGVLDYAIEEGKQQEDCKAEHRDGNSSGEGPKAGGGDSFKRRRQAKKKVQAKEV